MHMPECSLIENTTYLGIQKQTESKMKGLILIRLMQSKNYLSPLHQCICPPNTDEWDVLNTVA